MRLSCLHRLDQPRPFGRRWLLPYTPPIAVSIGSTLAVAKAVEKKLEFMLCRSGTCLRRLLPAHLYDVIKKGPPHFFEPVRNAVGNHDHVAFVQRSLCAAGDFLRAGFAHVSRSGLDGVPARDESC